MITRSGLDFVRLTRHVGPLLAVLLPYDILITALYVVLNWRWVAIDDLPLPLLGSAIALVVTLRNNAAYARWWEARALWGAVVNNSRSFTRGLVMLVDDPVLRNTLVRHQIAYVLALRCHLLKVPPWDAVEPYLPAATVAALRPLANVPAGIHVAAAHLLGAARARDGVGGTGAVDSVGLAALDRTLSKLADAQGGLERIKNTPLPRQYNQFPQIFTSVYCLLLPIGLVRDLGFMTPIGSTVIGFMFLALDRIGRDLEDPFENTIHDIPMQAITRTIEIDLLQSVDAPDPPDPVLPQNGVLW